MLNITEVNEIMGATLFSLPLGNIISWGGSLTAVHSYFLQLNLDKTNILIISRKHISDPVEHYS